MENIFCPTDTTVLPVVCLIFACQSVGVVSTCRAGLGVVRVQPLLQSQVGQGLV